MAAALLAALVLAGCGGSSDDSSAPALTKAEFVAKGDAICERTDKRQATEFGVYVEENGENKSKAGEEDLVTNIGLPAIRIEIEELRELGVPAGDEEEIAAILDEAEEAVEEAEEDPGKVLREADDPFREVEKLAKAYGFKECGLT